MTTIKTTKEIIQGRDIVNGDLIQSAAMRHPLQVRASWPSSTGRTMEVKMSNGLVYRVGMNSKVKRFQVTGDVR